MNIFLTSGTVEFMEALHQQFENEQMLIMYGDENALLLHETTGKTRFQAPLRYEIIASFGSFQMEGFFAFHYIPTTDEGKPIFEHQFQSRADLISMEAGFIAMRFLRPIHSNTYVVLTQWADEDAFKLWKNSSLYAYLADDSSVGRERKPHIFDSASYVTVYQSEKEEKNDEEEDNDEWAQL